MAGEGSTEARAVAAGYAPQSVDLMQLEHKIPAQSLVTHKM